MKLITQRQLIRDLPKRWQRQYAGEKLGGRDKNEILERLKELDPETATKHDVAKIIENYSWTRLICEQCAEDSVCVIVIGGKTPGSKTSSLCLPCIQRAAELAKEGEG